MWWPTAASKSWSTARRFSSPKSRSRPHPLTPPRPLHESISAIHSAAGRNFAADGRNSAGGHRRIHAVAGLGAAGGRLPDDPGAHLLSRRQPRRDGDHRHCAAGAPVRRDAGAEPDDLDQRRRRVGHRASVQPLALARRGRRRGAVVDQRRDRHFCLPICRSRRSTTRPIPPTRRSSLWPSAPTACRCRRSRTWSIRAWRRGCRS